MCFFFYIMQFKQPDGFWHKNHLHASFRDIVDKNDSDLDEIFAYLHKKIFIKILISRVQSIA